MAPGISHWRRAAFVAGALCAPTIFTVVGCFAVANLDRFHPAPEGGVDDPTKPNDLVFTMQGMSPHLHQLVEFRVIDANNFIQSRGIIDTLEKPDAVSITLTVPKAIPVDNRPYRLDFYADVNQSGGYDGLDTGFAHDHAWRIAPLVDYPAGDFPHVANEVQVLFAHNTSFSDIDKWPTDGPINKPQDTGVDVVVRFTASKLGVYAGALLQVRVVQAHAPNHVVGLYRKPQIPTTDFEGTIPGVVEPGDSYFVDVYIDANKNAAYDNPASSSAGDLGWRFPVTASSLPEGGVTPDAGADAGASVVGIDFTFDPTASASDVDVGPP